MNVRIKALITVLLVGTVIGVLTLQTSNKSLFKGQIKLNKTENTDESQPDQALKPDLRPLVKVLPPDQAGGDIKVDVTVENLGPGEVKGEKTFKYSIYVNNVEVLGNTDSYSAMAAGDSFNFVYPVPRLIYNYADSGKVKVIVDVDNAIEEEHEDNNENEVSFSVP